MKRGYFQRAQLMLPNNRQTGDAARRRRGDRHPVGTPCGFAVNIGRARFFFTPGVPRELRRMLEEQVIPRLLAASGKQTAIYLKRFHSYGIGESHADSLLAGVEALAPDGSVKLGFRAHYPQLETKLTGTERDPRTIYAEACAGRAKVRKRLGNFIRRG
jgi:nicotinamide-nucleotide amidase